MMTLLWQWLSVYVGATKKSKIAAVSKYCQRIPDAVLRVFYRPVSDLMHKTCMLFPLKKQRLSLFRERKCVNHA